MDTHLEPTGRAPTGDAESMIRTFLIADIRGYTRFSDARGDEAAARLAERFVSIARDQIEARSGSIVEVRGDEILAVFNSARHAVLAAVDLQAAVEAATTPDTPLGIGVGIDAGEAVPLRGGYRGRALNLAARLCARARPGEILVTPELVHLAGTVQGVGFEDRGPVRLKGISKAVHLIAVTRPQVAGGPPPTAEPLTRRFEFRLLGPLEATEDSRPIPLGGPRQRLVLAHLLLGANRVVSMEDLVDRVWDGEPPQAARNTIQSYVSHLRSGLGVDRIEGRVPGYILHAEAEELDILRFEQLVRRARRQLPVEPREAVATLGDALDLWHGPPLSDLADAPSLAGEIARLQEMRLGALEDLLGARLALGQHAEALPDLERLIAEHPLRERLWAHLVLARYRSGLQADALEGYRRAQELLNEELGIDPSPELQDLHRRILQQDPTLQLTGKPLRGYRLLERVGEGSFGVVYRALDPELGRDVAIKQIHPRLADDSRFVRRFEQEAQAIARVEHPHVVPLYDYWRDGTGAFLVMRWMRGGSLEEVLGRGPVEAAGAVQIVDQVSSALSAAHRAHTVHRDVRPANVLLDEEGNAYLSDFGIAYDLAGWTTDELSSSAPAYRSPEQLRGEPVTPRSDIYGLGMLVQDLLEGSGAAVESVGEVVGRATADDPADRFADARDVAVALRDALGLSSVRSEVRTRTPARNPYKGLLPFSEADADDFFGRDALVDRLVTRLAEPVEGSRFLALVGPSGSGKSSVARAGLVPTLRRGALPGSDRWFYVEMLPGAHPMEELEAALLRIAVNPPRSLLELLERDEEGLARTLGRLLPDDGTELLLLVDQLEEVFTMVEEETARDLFLKSIVAAVHEPRARLRVVTTLRADFYDRPLSYPGLAELIRGRSETLIPLTPEELERAISGPADRVGIVPELALVAEMVADVSDRPAALPLLQYALTELFDRRRGTALTLEAYRDIDGITGAIARRAEELFHGLTEPQRESARQLFLRLVTPGEGLPDTRRLVPRTELLALQVDRQAMEVVIDTYGRHRMLAFDRDPTTRGPTVEVAHEALLSSWERLRIWIDDARDDLRQHRRVAAAAAEWEGSGRDPSLLLRGSRLEQIHLWEESTDLALSKPEKEYVGASLRQRSREESEEHSRADRERALERRSLRRLRALVAVLTAAAVVAAGLTAIAVSRTQEAERRRDDATISALTQAALSNLGVDPNVSLQLALHALNASLGAGKRVTAETVEALHWALQESGIEYPVRDRPSYAVAGPLGKRGIFDLPVSEVANLALAHADRSLPRIVCEQFFGRRTCPSLPDRFPGGLQAEPVVGPGTNATAKPLAGTQVLLGVFSPRDQPELQAELERFTERTGIDVRLVESTGVAGADPGSGSARDRPDISFTGSPQEVVELGRQGLLMDLSTFIDIEQLKQDQSPYLVSMATVAPDGTWPSHEGATYGAFISLDAKNLIWYPVPEFGTSGYTIPRTWPELIDLSDRMVADGRTPWCVGFLSQDSNGWPGTDWIESLLLAEAGPEAYDRWSMHQLPFDSPPIRQAFRRLGEILHTPRYTFQAVGPERYHDLAQSAMVDHEPPQCWLYRSPTFAAGFLEDGAPGTVTDVFGFPSIDPRFAHTAVGGGTIITALSDRPEVREVLKFFLSPHFGTEWAKVGNGSFLSANRRFDLNNYQLFWRTPARIIDDALAADLYRLDASDIMPQEVGGPPFWAAMMTFLEDGSTDLSRLLRELDAAWPEEA